MNNEIAQSVEKQLKNQLNKSKAVQRVKKIKINHQNLESFCESKRMDYRIKYKSKKREMDTESFAKRLDNFFLPTNVVMRVVILLASYIFIFGPGASPTIHTLMQFLALAALLGAIMDFTKMKSPDPEKFTEMTFKASIFLVPLLLLAFNAFTLPKAFSFAIVTLMLISPLLLVIGSRWKISAHTCVFTAMATVMSLVNSQAVVMFLMLPIMTWSKMKTRTHTGAQIIAGAALGMVATLAFAQLLPLI